MENRFKKMFIAVVTNRMLMLAVAFVCLFYVLAVKLFRLQIVEGELYNNELNIKIYKEITVPATRGAIYDRYGRPLAINRPTYTVKINPVVQTGDLNASMLNLANFLDENDERYDLGFPVTRETPRRFLFTSEKAENRWKEDMNVPLDATPEEAVAALRKLFKISDDVSDGDAFTIISFRSKVYMNRYTLEPVTVAFDVKERTVVKFEEHIENYTSAYTEVEPMREYPAGYYVSHLIGYYRNVDMEESGANMTGLERAFNGEFKGTDGVSRVETNQNGKVLSVLENSTNPVQGNRLYTTLDLDLQKKAYDILEAQLIQVIKNKMSGKSSRETPITTRKALASLVKSGSVAIAPIMESGGADYSWELRNYVLQSLPTANYDTIEGRGEIKEIICAGVENGDVSQATIILVMLEQGVITGGEALAENVANGRFGVLQTLLDKIDAREITPQMLNLDPSTGSAVVVDVATGGVLAAVSYPSYDNNQFVNYFNDAYYQKINADPTYPMYNRAFMEGRAPGSTFKMISATAGLESGAITSSTRIYDELVFTKAGRPYARCWSSASHGSINVVKALAFSCNYFFCEVAYRMGSGANGTQGINTLNKYMIEYGLNDRSGVEIGELRDTLPDDILAISTPEYKEYLFKQRDPESPYGDYRWTDGDTVRTAFGQSENRYTAATMAKYIAALASGGVRRDLHFMQRVETPDGKIKEIYASKDYLTDISSETIDVIYDGMQDVIKSGTAQTVFRDFPVSVAGKTGTAQEISNRNDHASFGGFAPAEDPEIAVYVSIPFGDTMTTSAPAAQVARDIIAAYFGVSKETAETERARSLSS
jgi:cell division protein FtsI/penicillin-binding protein 2